MKIAIYSHHQFEHEFIEGANDEDYALQYTEEKLSMKTTDFSKGCKAVLVFSSDKVNADVLNKLKEQGVALIVTRSAGTDHIDLKQAKELDLKVANVPSYSPNAIAEQCIALTLALFRKLKPSISRIENYNFSLNGQVGTEINKKTFGICGTGDIGEVLAHIANGFGAKILLFDAVENPNLTDVPWAQYVGKEELLKQADIISLNLPLNDDTADFIAKEDLELIKKSAVLINTGRGDLVDTQAVYEALVNDALAGFGMDVYENEKGIFYHDLSEEEKRDELLISLMKLDNVVVTAHQAFLTTTALENMMATVFKSVRQFEKGEELKNRVES